MALPPYSKPWGLCPESPAAKSRHGARDRHHRQATRGRFRWACDRRSRHGRLLRRESKAPVARHLPRRPPTGVSSSRSTFDRDVFQSSPDELPAIDIHSL